MTKRLMVTLEWWDNEDDHEEYIHQSTWALNKIHKIQLEKILKVMFDADYQLLVVDSRQAYFRKKKMASRG